MLIINIILILLYCLSLSFQTIKSGLFCYGRILNIYVYEEGSADYRLLQSLENPVYYDNVDYVDLDVAPGSLIKFECRNDYSETFGGGCFLVNNKCHCYEFNTKGFDYDKFQFRTIHVDFNNGVNCSQKVGFLKEKAIGTYEYYHHVPLDADEIKCNPTTILAPISSKRSIKFSNYIKTPFNITNLNISVDKNHQIFTLNNQQLSPNTKFNILSDLEYSHDQNSEIHIQFINYGVEIDDNEKTCEINIRFCDEVENNECINHSYLSIIILLIIGVLIIIAIIFFIKNFLSRKKSEEEISNNIEKIDSNNQLINVFL